MQNRIKTKEILILKNITREGPGIIEIILKEIGISYTIADLSSLTPLPSVKNYQCIIILGGPDSANDTSHKMKDELALISEAIKAEIPYLGICLGMQTLVKAAGGKVVKSPVKEVGFRDPDGDFFKVELTDYGRKDPLFNGMSQSFNVFQLHGETVVLTENMKLLANGKFCESQIVKIGSNAYGIQCHFELTHELFEEWIREESDLKLLDKEKLRIDFEAIKEEYSRTGVLLFKNFLCIAGII
jgi:GMP synthase-like glutamine amidotransferase